MPNEQVAAILKAAKAKMAENRLAYYAPYQKQKDFHAAGANHRERLFMAGNQLGKTWSGAYECAMHLTGKYPEWWSGKRFVKPVRAWAAGKNGRAVRDALQALLLGPTGQHGTGSLPKTDIDSVKKASGVADLIDNIQVKHVSGGTSFLGFKTYEEGREAWQAATLDFVWFDEEPPEPIYTEGLTRTNATGGMVYMTFTPLLGRSNVVNSFLVDPPAFRSTTRMNIYDVDHYTDEQRVQIIQSYPAHEREARANGEPTLGEGAIFPVKREDIECEAFEIPKHWAQIAGIDFGWTHPTSAARIAWDRDDDVIYVTHVYRVKEATPILHAAALKAWGKGLPWSWPHDGNNDTAAGSALAGQYRDQGLELLPERATHEDGSNSLEAGLMEMLDRFQSGRLKIFKHLTPLFDEIAQYHRKDGKVVKVFDDTISALRYAIMMKRFARTIGITKKIAYKKGTIV